MTLGYSFTEYYLGLISPLLTFLCKVAQLFYTVSWILDYLATAPAT